MAIDGCMYMYVYVFIFAWSLVWAMSNRKQQQVDVFDQVLRARLLAPLHHNKRDIGGRQHFTYDDQWWGLAHILESSLRPTCQIGGGARIHYIKLGGARIHYRLSLNETQRSLATVSMIN